MKMASSSCSVTFYENPNGVYSGGQVLSGKINLVTLKIKSIKGIFITIRGYAESEWTEEESRNGSEGINDTETITYLAREEYFSSRVDVLVSENGNRFDLIPGTYNFEFETHLPRNLPSSYSGRYGEIHYEVVCTIDRPWRFNNVFRQSFTIVSEVDLNLNPIYRKPTDRTTIRYFSKICCCGEAGHILVRGCIPYNGFAPGQSIPVTVFVKDLSKIDCHQANIKLVQMIEYKSYKPRSKSKYESIDVAVQKFGALEKSYEKEFKCYLSIPAIPPSGLGRCKIIEITYFIDVQVKTKGLHNNMNVRLPITIGTVPIFHAAATPNNNVICSQPLSLQGGVNESNFAALVIAAPPSYEEATRYGPRYINNSEENNNFKQNDFLPKYPVYYSSSEISATPSHSNSDNNNNNCEDADLPSVVVK